MRISVAKKLLIKLRKYKDTKPYNFGRRETLSVKLRILILCRRSLPRKLFNKMAQPIRTSMIQWIVAAINSFRSNKERAINKYAITLKQHEWLATIIDDLKKYKMSRTHNELNIIDSG